MFLVLYIFILFMNLLLAVVEKKSKLLQGLTYILFCYILQGNSYVADYNNYELSYTLHKIGDQTMLEIGYVLLEKIFWWIGAEYSIFRLCINIIILYLLFRIIKKHVHIPHMSYFIYGIFLLFMDTIQLRFFWASVIALVAIELYLSKSNKYPIKTVLVFALASLIHTGALMIVITFLMMEFLSLFKKYYKIVVAVFVIISIYFLTHIDFREYSYLINQTVLRRYLYTSVNSGFLFAWIIQFIQLGRAALINQKRGLLSDSELEIWDKLNKFVISGCIFLPLYSINLNFYRFLRFMLLNAICYEVALIQKQKANKYLVFGTFVIECVGWILYELIFDGFMDNILIPIFG